MSTYPPDDSTPIYDRSTTPEPGYPAGASSVEPVLTPATTNNTPDASTGSGKADAAKSAASDVADDAKGAAADVAGTAKDQAKRVASEATDHAKDLYGQASAGLQEQAGQQQERAAGGLRSLSEQLGSMADNSDEDGVAQKVVRDLSQRAGSAAGFLENRDPGSLLDEVKSFAARRPGTFIALAAGAGILAGRLTKALATETKHDHDQTTSTTDTTPGARSTTPETGA
jgi:F0F1-type ATP synthase membrane subunit b/b'